MTPAYSSREFWRFHVGRHHRFKRINMLHDKHRSLALPAHEKRG